MRPFAALLLSTLLSLGSMQASAAVVAFDFYRLISPPFPPLILPVDDGTNVNTLYLSESGVTFGCFNGTSLNLCVNAANGGNAYARTSASAASAPNVVYLSASGFPLFDERFGYLKASFNSPLGVVSIDAQPVPPPEGFTVTVNRPFLQAFNSLGQFLGTANYNYGACNPNTTQCPWKTLTITRLQNDIKFVAYSSYSSSGGVMYGQFDNLQFAAAQDTDSDGIANNLDNCTDVPNTSQLDADQDGYGNYCDGDINNSGTVTTADFGLMRSVLGQPASFNATAAAADMNGSGTVTTADFGLLRARLGTAPGPSGLACAGTVPCP